MIIITIQHWQHDTVIVVRHPASWGADAWLSSAIKSMGAQGEEGGGGEGGADQDQDHVPGKAHAVAPRPMVPVPSTLRPTTLILTARADARMNNSTKEPNVKLIVRDDQTKYGYPCAILEQGKSCCGPTIGMLRLRGTMSHARRAPSAPARATTCERVCSI